jgi:hypothetical protein
MSTLETQYRKFLEANQKLKLSFEEWKKVNARLIKQALINMMKDDEELGLYDEPFKHKVEVLSKEEILANRSNAYEFIDFDKQERMYSEEDLKSAFLDGWQLRDGDLPFPKAKKKWFKEFKKQIRYDSNRMFME